MFRTFRESFRRLVVAVEALAEGLASWQPASPAPPDGEILGRLDELERSRALWEAELEARFLRAEEEKKLARNAEERTRALARKLAPAGDEDGEDGIPEEYARLIRGGDAAGGAEEGVQPLRPVVGSSREAGRQAARRYKFGG